MTNNLHDRAAAGPAVDSALASEIARRRTFAIISHPDAGKTTLTEKLLLYAGAVEIAGAVRGRKNQRHVTSDWMEMERERGISITSTALQFEYQGYRLNLLDTPGHQDFSEDTYRTLMAVDSAVMVLDSAKGIEAQTLKLFEVCRMRRIPILTFINKLDLQDSDPLALLDEIEQVLQIGAVPMNWPIGSGPSFQGVYDLERRQVALFEHTTHGQHRAPVRVAALDDPTLDTVLGPRASRRLREEIDLITGAGAAFDLPAFLRGDVTPVFFGSALNNFGVAPFLDALLEYAPAPVPRPSDHGLIAPANPAFSGFIFKIQANMDPLHRDRMAFLRVCSGHFEKDMLVWHARLGRKIRMTRPHRLFARERETVEEAFPGDVVGLTNPGLFAIGDTLCSGAPFQYTAMPRFAPECFGRLTNRDIAKHKQFHKGLTQLEEEGVIQVFHAADQVRREPILAAVGDLQFDVVAARLRSEYGVETTIERLPLACARWVVAEAAAVAKMRWLAQTVRTTDRENRLVALFGSEWELNYCQRENPDVVFQEAA